MTKYKYVLTFEDGEKLDSEKEYKDLDMDKAIFDSYEEAEEAGLYEQSCARDGAEILNMSNPGDYEYDEETYKLPKLRIVEVKYSKDKLKK